MAKPANRRERAEYTIRNSDPEHIHSPNMLRFLSRDSRNAQAVVTLKRKADAVALTSKAKKKYCEQGFQTFRDGEVDVLVNADETFIRFFPETSHVIAPIGAKRVGSTNDTQDKKGLTGMLCMEMYTSTVLDPFVVLDGTYDGTLNKQWSRYGGTANVNFQKNHWWHCEEISALAQKSVSWEKNWPHLG